ncbi:cellulase [Verticiella sediminum]|uniref:cellulase n=2 Tax=Verticiella sediminum TaxID=1247510 RepID=A0A556AXR1_9BURK|nr:cellulase [Verticiella sediminum]
MPARGPRLLARLAGLVCVAGLCATAQGQAVPAHAGAACVTDGWPLWRDFTRLFLQEDGRVVDPTVPQMHSTSESQSYAMFFALVANDRASFARIWHWSVDNLLGGDATARLPAWRWGKREDGGWGPLDTNAASDADLWFAYALLEAARLWRAPDYERQGRALLDRIAQEEVADLPGLGDMLLPGPQGFALEQGVWRLNPSYQPLPVLRLLANRNPSGPWSAIAEANVRMLEETTPHGYAADWVAYQANGKGGGEFIVDPAQGAVGSYDAIRTYLWAGMTPPSDPLASPTLARLGGMAQALQDAELPPETVDTRTGQTEGTRGFGFSAALLPYLQALRAPAERVAAMRQEVDGQLARHDAPLPDGQQAPYYDYMLSLFGLGYMDQHYRFLASGALQTRWEKTCRAPQG